MPSRCSFVHDCHRGQDRCGGSWLPLSGFTRKPTCFPTSKCRMGAILGRPRIICRLGANRNRKATPASSTKPCSPVTVFLECACEFSPSGATAGIDFCFRQAVPEMCGRTDLRGAVQPNERTGPARIPDGKPAAGGRLPKQGGCPGSGFKAEPNLELL